MPSIALPSGLHSEETGCSIQTAIGAILNDARPAASHRRIFWLICAVMFVDFYDLTMGGAIAASLLRDEWTTLALNSMFFSAAGGGAAVGVFAAGFLADRIGRIKVLQLSLALMTFGTLLCAVAPTMWFLIASRTLAAIGMGALPTIGYVYLSEVLPARVRGSWVSGLGVIVAASSSVASVAAFYLLPIGAWRLMFFMPAVAGLLLAVALQLIPESPRWLAAQGKLAKATDALARITAERAPLSIKSHTAPVTTVVVSPSEISAKASALFRAPLFWRLILGAGLAVGATVTSNSAVAWMPTVLLASGSVARGLGDNLVIMLGAPLGSVVGYFIINRVSRRGAIAATSIAASCLAVICAYLDRGSGLVPVALILMASINLVCTLILGVYLPELFPTSLRARGSSFALTLSRLVLIAAPFGVAMILTAFGGMGFMFFLAACLLGIALLVVLLGVETAATPLAD